MGKKGKVEAKRKRQAYFAQKKKEARRERRQKLKSRKPLSQDMQNIRDGITQMIIDQGAEPQGAAYFGCLMSLLDSRPEPKVLPYVFALLDYYLPDISPGLLRKHCAALMTKVAAQMREHLADHLIVKKAHNLFKSLFYYVPPTREMFNILKSIEPNKLSNELMPLYLKTTTAAFVLTFEKAPQLARALYYPTVTWATSNFFDTQEVVANATAKMLAVVFEETLDTELIGEKSEMVNKILRHFVGCIKDLQYRDNWDHLCESITAILAKVALTRSVLPVDELFGATITQEVLPVVDKVRALGDFRYNSACDKVFGAAVRCLGCERVLDVVPLNPLDLDPVGGRHHLLEVLRRNVSHDRIAFFIRHFAPLIHRVRQAEEQALLHGKHLERRTLQMIHQQLWDLLPGFASFPQDLTQGTSYQTIAKELTKMLNDPELGRVASRVFVILIENATYLAEYEPEEAEMEEDEEGEEGEEEEDEQDDVVDEEAPAPAKDKDDGSELDPMEQAEAQLPAILDSLDFCRAPPEADPHAFHRISREQAESYLQLVGTFAKNVIPRICNAIEKEEGHDRRGLLLQALRSYASVADPGVIATVFKQVSRTLIETTRAGEDGVAPKLTDEQRRKNRVMMEIGCVICEDLDKDALLILLQIIYPLLTDDSDDYHMQKKSYKVLSRVLQTREDVVAENVGHVVDLLAAARETCDMASRKERVMCLIHTAELLNEQNEIDRLHAFIRETTHEVIMTLKDSSTKSRDASFACLGTYAAMMGVNKFTQSVVLAGLAAEKPQFLSGTIITLSKLLDEHHNELDRQLKVVLIKAVFKFVRSPATEVKNSAMGFARLALKVVARSDEVRLIVEAELPGLVQSCIAWTSQKMTPGNTRRAVQMILERCIRRFGYDHMLAIYPEEHRQQIIYVEAMRQREIRKEQKLKERRQEKHAQAKTKKFNELFFGEKQDDQRGALRESTEELDLLDDNVAKRFVTEKQRTVLDGLREDRGKADGMNVALRGDKIMIQSEADYKRDMRHELLQRKLNQLEGTQRTALEDLSGGVLQKRKRRRDDDDEEDVAGFNADAAYDPQALQAKREFEELQRALKGPSKKDRPRESRRSRIDSDVRTGDQFRAKQGSYGDVKKGGTDPYAYVPLNAKFLNKRHIKKGISRVAAVAETAPKGKSARK